MFPLYRIAIAPKHFGMKNVSDRPSVSTVKPGISKRFSYRIGFTPSLLNPKQLVADRFHFEVLRNDSQVETGKRNDLYSKTSFTSFLSVKVRFIWTGT